MLHLFVRNTVEAPYQCIDEQCFKFRSWRRARDAWTEFARTCPPERNSPDFHEGFLEGYVDYLDAGGTGLPPAAPPARYWQTKYQDPAGVRAIQDWYAGFRAGSEAARLSGYRDTILVPLSSLPGHGVIAGHDAVAPIASDPELPAPRKVTSSDGKPDGQSPAP
jgi:hypothetical protein